MCFNEDWRYQFTLANDFCLLELIWVALGHLDELQKAKKYPIRWSLYTGFTVLFILQQHCTNRPTFCRHRFHGHFLGSLQWRHNDHDGVSNHQTHGCYTQPFRPKKISKLRVNGLCAGNSPVTGEFPAQRASNTENVSIWWRHHVNISIFWFSLH